MAKKRLSIAFEQFPLPSLHCIYYEYKYCVVTVKITSSLICSNWSYFHYDVFLSLENKTCNWFGDNQTNNQPKINLTQQKRRLTKNYKVW